MTTQVGKWSVPTPSYMPWRFLDGCNLKRLRFELLPPWAVQPEVKLSTVWSLFLSLSLTTVTSRDRKTHSIDARVVRLVKTHETAKREPRVWIPPSAKFFDKIWTWSIIVTPTIPTCHQHKHETMVLKEKGQSFHLTINIYLFYFYNN